jgi:hypothetical protein
VRASTLNNVSPRGEIALLLEPRDLIEPDWNISRFRTESENFGTQQRFDSKQQSQNLFQCSNVPTIFKRTQAKSFLSLKRRHGRTPDWQSGPDSVLNLSPTGDSQKAGNKKRISILSSRT